MLSFCEHSIYQILNFFPYLPLLLYPFRNNLRFSRRVSALLLLLATALQFGILMIGIYTDRSLAELLSYCALAANLAIFFVGVKATPGRMIFNLLMTINVANCVVMAAKCLEGQLFPVMALEGYRWSYSLCIALVQVLILFPTFFYIKTMCNKYPRNSDSKMWDYTFLVPLTFSVVWFYVFYHCSTLSSLEMALLPKNTVFNLFILFGQEVIYGYIVRLVSNYDERLRLQEEQHFRDVQNSQLTHMQERIDEARILRHDMRHQLIYLSSLLEQEQYDKAKTYLAQYSKSVSDHGTLHYTDHPALNLLLVSLHSMCANAGITLTVQLGIPAQLPLTDDEITVLFGNLVENAYHAALTMPEGRREIRISGRMQASRLVFLLENTYSNEIRRDSQGNFLTTKSSGSGLGTRSARNIVERCGGVLKLEADAPYFTASILLPAQRPAAPAATPHKGSILTRVGEFIAR